MKRNNRQKNTPLGIRLEFLICLFLGLITLAVYWPVKNYEFINFDDNVYVTENYYIQNGLTSKSISWSFSFKEKAETYWQPLTWLSHMLDCQLFGLDAGMHHLASLIIHILNSILLFLAFKRMTGELWKSVFVALLFALHPINVDSVAWVSERKNLLSTFFWILSMLSYAIYCERPGLLRYLSTCFVFTLGLLAKPMLVTLPCIFLLMDYWPLGRIPILSISSICKKIVEKVPLFILSGISIYLSTSSIKGFAMMISMEQRPMALRIANALVSYVSYVGKLIWPQNLSVFYPYPGMIPTWKVLCSGLFLIFASVLVALTVRKRPYLSVGWFWFLGAFVPVIGLVQPGLWPAMADRWAYIPFIGLFITIAWGIPDFLINRQSLQKRLLIPIVGAFFLVTLTVTCKQVQYYEDSITLFSHAIDVTVNNNIAHTNLGQALSEKGRIDEAKSHFIKALQIDPKDKKAQFNLGVVLSSQNNTRQAIEHYQKALNLDPDFSEAANNLAWIYATNKNQKFRNGTKAVELAEHAVKVLNGENPALFYILDTLAAAYAETGHYKKAYQTGQRASKLAKSAGDSVTAAEMQKRLLLYRSEMPFRE